MYQSSILLYKIQLRVPTLQLRVSTQLFFTRDILCTLLKNSCKDKCVFHKQVGYTYIYVCMHWFYYIIKKTCKLQKKTKLNIQKPCKNSKKYSKYLNYIKTIGLQLTKKLPVTYISYAFIFKKIILKSCISLNTFVQKRKVVDFHFLEPLIKFI